MQKSPPVITLLTDFGHHDAFVGIMKGVILKIAPHARLVDLSHLIPPQDIKQAAYILMTASPFFPEGTVHLVVVDPGVGSTRRLIAVETPSAYYVAPDNGVLSYALAIEDRYQIAALTNPDYQLKEVSSTFHGRDIFSPAAAYLAAGVPLGDLGPEVTEPVLLNPPHLKLFEDRLEGEVLNIDHFGNLRTSLLKFTWLDEAGLRFKPLFREKEVPASGIVIAGDQAQIKIGGLRLTGISTTFSDVHPGQALAYVGSEGGLEIAVNQGNAAREFGVDLGEIVSVYFS